MEPIRIFQTVSEGEFFLEVRYPQATPKQQQESLIEVCACPRIPSYLGPLSNMAGLPLVVSPLLGKEEWEKVVLS
jgi:hypothetical protein